MWQTVDELKAPETIWVWADGLKTHSAPQLISYYQDIKMPVAGPQKEVLNLRNIILVTQRQATTPEHRKAYLEVVRVDGIAKKKTGERGKEAKNLLVSLRNQLLAKSEQFTIELTHAHLPVHLPPLHVSAQWLPVSGAEMENGKDQENAIQLSGAH